MTAVAEVLTVDKPWLTSTSATSPIYLATCKAPHLTATENFTTSFAELIERFTQKPEIAPVKEGPGFLIGPCKDVRKNINLPYGCVAVIDADSSINPDGSVSSGAPAPQLVHEALVSFEYSHLIYTTYSHGTGRGNRYRIVLPIYVFSVQELSAVVTHVAELLQSKNIPLALSRESSVWSQLWAYPRVSGDCAPYETYSYVKYMPDAKYLARQAGLLDDKDQPVSWAPPPLARPEVPPGLGDSVIGLFCRYYPTEHHLLEHGYTFVNEQVQHGAGGDPVLLQRWKKPGSHSSAGVILFKGPNGSKAYSHHGNDPLNNGHSNDSFEVFKLLNGLEESPALEVAVNMIQAAVANELNEIHPSIMEDGKKLKFGNRCMDEWGNTYYAFMDKENFVNYMLNRGGVPIFKQTDLGTAITFIDKPSFWFKNTDRVTFNGSSYEPSPLMNPPERRILRGDNRHYFNIFNGWTVSPYPGKWPLLEWHLRHAICGSDLEQYDYLLNFFSNLVCDPKTKPGVAVALKGKKGWGKSKPFSLLAQSLGTNAITVGNVEQLTGRFNGHLSEKLLALVEESFWAGNKKSDGVLKHLITDSWTSVEKKQRDIAPGSSYVRVVMITNEDWVVPASTDERRYFLPTLTDASKRRDEEKGAKGGFFAQLYNEMQNGGIEAFFWDMAKRNAKLTDIINVPDTEGLRTQKLMSLSGVNSWLYSALLEARIETESTSIPWGPNGCQLPESQFKKAVSQAYSKYDQERNLDIRVNQTLFEVLGPSLVSRSQGLRCFGPIQECRKAFVKYSHLDDNIFNPAETSSEVKSNVVSLPHHAGGRR